MDKPNFLITIERIVSVAVFGLSVASIGHAQPQFGKLVVFGDSLSDGGAYTNFFKALNLPGASQVTRFKFTTNPGNVWVENIASRFGMTLTPNALDGGLNYAEGGARVALPNPSAQGLTQTPVSVQIDRFLGAGGIFRSNDIVTMLIGANDIFQGGPAAIAPAVSALITQLGRLQAAGAKNIILVSIPDIGLTPAFGSGSGSASAQGSQLAASFNTTLKQSLQGFSNNVLYIDAFTLFREAVASPGRYGLVNVTAPACLTPTSGQCTPATTVPNGAETYLFADGLHPTTAGHRILSDAVLATMLAPSQISLLPLSVQSSMRGQQLAYDERLRPQGDHSVRTFEFYGGAGYTPYKVDSSGQLNGVDTKSRDVTLGSDYQLSQKAGVGIAASHTDANTNFGNKTGSFKTKLTSLGIYARAEMRQAYVFAAGSYGWASLDDIRRDVHINTAVRSEFGETSGHTAVLKAGGGYDISIGRWTAGPIAGLNYEPIRVGSYAERGSSSTQLTFGSQTLSQVTGSAGVEARLADNSAAFVPYARATYDYDLTHDTRRVSILSQGSVVPFQGAAYLPERGAVSITGGTRARIASNVHAVINASGLLGPSHTGSYGVTAIVDVSF